MKKSVLGLMFLGLFVLTSFIAYTPIEGNAMVSYSQAHEDDGDLCPDSGSGCSVVSPPDDRLDG